MKIFLLNFLKTFGRKFEFQNLDKNSISKNSIFKIKTDFQIKYLFYLKKYLGQKNSCQNDVTTELE